MEKMMAIKKWCKDQRADIVLLQEVTIGSGDKGHLLEEYWKGGQWLVNGLVAIWIDDGVGKFGSHGQ